MLMLPPLFDVPTGHDELQAPGTQLDSQQEDIAMSHLSRHLLSIGELLCLYVECWPTLLAACTRGRLDQL